MPRVLQRNNELSQVYTELLLSSEVSVEAGHAQPDNLLK